MKTKLKVVLLLSAVLLALTISSTALAVPSANTICQFSQPSGEKFIARINGDENLNWLETEAGDILMLSPDGNYRHAAMTSAGLQAGTTTFSPSLKTTGAITVNNLSEYLPSSSSAYSLNTTLNAIGPPAAKIKGPHKALVLLIEFADVGMQNTDPSLWNNLIFGDSGSTVNSYFKEGSNNQFYLIPAQEALETENDGVVRVTLPYDHPSNYDWIDKPAGKVVQDALIAADQFMDFTIYDTNGDGNLMPDELHIIAVFAGYERSISSKKPSVWAHRGQLGGIYLDGIRYVGYHTAQGEMHGDNMATAGVFCHELGHDLALRDLYATDGSSNGVGLHSLMGSGSWGCKIGEKKGTTPTHLDPWSKAFLGFVTPQTITSDGVYTLNAAPNDYNTLMIPTANPSEYFLLENRQFNGFDEALEYRLSAGGIAIWHIDESKYNNNNVDHKFVDLEEANEGVLGFSQLDTRDSRTIYEHYYSPVINTIFNHDSTPNSRLYNGEATNISIITDSTSADIMQVTIEIGSEEEPDPEPGPLTIESLTPAKPSPQKIYNTIRWTCDTSGGSENKLYKFDVYNGLFPVKYGTWTSNNYFDWMPLMASPFYKVTVTVMDQSDFTIVSQTSPYYAINLF